MTGRVVGTLVGLLIGLGASSLVRASAPGSAPQGDAFASQADDDPYAVGAARRWYDNHPDDVKTRASGCLSLLDEAKAYQDAALALFDQATQAGNSRTQSALVAKGNEQIALRTQKLSAFMACVNQAMRAPGSDEFGSNGGAKGLTRTPGPPARRPNQPATLAQVIDACFGEKDPLYRAPDWSRALTAAERSQTGAASFAAAFKASGVAAEQALRLDEQAYGAWTNREQMLDYLTGWVAHCLGDRGATPRQDPRVPYRAVHQVSLRAVGQDAGRSRRA